MKTAVKAGLVAGLGALAGAAVIGGATTKADSYGSCSGDDYSINCSSDYYYWRRWQLPQPNRFLKRWLLLQQRLGRLVETRHQSVRRSLTLLVAALALALSGCAGQGNAATTPVTPTHGDGGNFLPFYVQQLQQPQQPQDHCHQPQTLADLLTPCDEGGGR